MPRPLRILSGIAGLALLAGLCGAFGLGEFRRAMAAASLPGIALFLAATLTVFAAYAVRWRVVLRGIGISVPLGSLLLFRSAAHATSTLLPSAHLSGEPVRAWLLRRRGVAWGDAVLAVALDRVLEATASAIVGPVYVAIFLAATGSAPRTAAWTLGAMTAGGLGLGLLYVHAARAEGWFVSLVRRLRPALAVPAARFHEGFVAFVRGPSFLPALVLSLAVEALIVAEFWMLTRAFHVELPLPTILAVLVGMGASHFAPIPGALGSLEAVQVGVVSLAGGAADLGLAVGLLVRLRETLWTLVGLGFLYLRGFRGPWPSSPEQPAETK